MGQGTEKRSIGSPHWYKCARYFDSEERKIVAFDKPYLVKGKLEDHIIVQLDANVDYGSESAAKVFWELEKQLGHSNILVIPSTVEFMRFQRIPAKEADRILKRRMRERGYDPDAEADGDGDGSGVGEQRPGDGGGGEKPADPSSAPE